MTQVAKLTLAASALTALSACFPIPEQSAPPAAQSGGSPDYYSCVAAGGIVSASIPPFCVTGGETYYK